MNVRVCLILDNIRSAHNVGSILRTAEGLGIEKVYLCGYTPYPKQSPDKRLPYLADKIDSRIAKTALGAEKTQDWEHNDNIHQLLVKLKASGFVIAALEQSKTAIELSQFNPASDIALVVGNEVDGINSKLLAQCDVLLEITMKGQKESFNVSAAAAIAMFYLKNMV